MRRAPLTCLSLSLSLTGCLAEFPAAPEAGPADALAALDAAPRWLDADAPLDPDAGRPLEASVDAGRRLEASVDAGWLDAGGCLARPELCNGVDDDCDGQVDEGFDLGAACDVGRGACRAAGVMVCNGREASACSAAPHAAIQELCNDLDDDCDGQVDEDFDLGGPCVSGLGICARAGHLRCDALGEATCDAAPGPSGRELCNGVDDDCDGAVDEGLGGPPCARGVGACRAEGRLVCDGHDIVCDAVAGAPSVERCNGLDDDCDTVVDEGFDVGGDCRVGVGGCARDGVLACNQETGRAVCEGEPGSPVEELCNGVDDDCDGAVDEGFPVGEPCTREHGACVTHGAFACRADSSVFCLAPDPDADHDGFDCAADCDDDDPRVRPGAPEICGDGVDQDCNGVPDDGPTCDCVAGSRGGRRYLACPTARSWSGGAEWCRQYGARLVRFEDPAEERWLRGFLDATWPGRTWWFGLTDVAGEGQWISPDGRGAPYTNWADGEPNNCCGGEGCAQLRSDRGYRWNDAACLSAASVVCEDPCAPGTDADGDGVEGCGADCDDADPEVGAACP